MEGVMHGCAIPLPKRHGSRLGIRQHGPRPSPLFIKCSHDPQTAWILKVGGVEAVIEFALARVEMTCCCDQKRHWMAFVHSAQKLQNKLIQLEKEQASKASKSLSWEERRQVLIQREQQRRNGDAHRRLERSWAKPSTQRIEEQQLVLQL